MSSSYQDDLDTYKLRLGDYRIEEHDLQYTFRHLGLYAPTDFSTDLTVKCDNLEAERRKLDDELQRKKSINTVQSENKRVPNSLNAPISFCIHIYNLKFKCKEI
jgi:hypothetical protein